MRDYTDNVRRKNALTAGLLYLGLIIVGMYAFAYAFPQVKIKGDIEETMSNIIKSESLFRFAILCVLVMNVISIVLVLYLYELFRPLNKTMAAFMLLFLLIGVTISMINEINHFALLIVSSDTGSYTLAQVQNLSGLFIEMQKYGSYIAVIFWGLWLFPLGILLFKLETRISKVIGVMIIIAGAGYLFDSFIVFIFPNSGIIPLTDYTFIGELFLTIWLLFKSKHVEQLVLIHN